MRSCSNKQEIPTRAENFKKNQNDGSLIPQDVHISSGVTRHSLNKLITMSSWKYRTNIIDIRGFPLLIVLTIINRIFKRYAHYQILMRGSLKTPFITVSTTIHYYYSSVTVATLVHLILLLNCAI